jgi:hypothetical protein
MVQFTKGFCKYPAKKKVYTNWATCLATYVQIYALQGGAIVTYNGKRPVAGALLLCKLTMPVFYSFFITRLLIVSSRYCSLNVYMPAAMLPGNSSIALFIPLAETILF